MTILTLITHATLHGATVHTTRDELGHIATVQVIGLPGMTTWPLPVRAATDELLAVLR